MPWFGPAGGRALPAIGGLPASQAVLDAGPYDWVVLEVSSFQLEFPGILRPDVAVLLNVLPNHLDRHGTLAAYRNLKFRLFAALGASAMSASWLPALLRQYAALAGRRAR